MRLEVSALASRLSARIAQLERMAQLGDEQLRRRERDRDRDRDRERGSRRRDRDDERRVRREERSARREERSSRRRKRRQLTPEERAYLDARRRANRKVTFLGHGLIYLTVCVLILFVAGFRPAFITALSWGIGLAAHWFFAVIAPDLRSQLVDREVEKRVHRSVSTERQVLRGEHQKNMEQLSASIAHEIRNPITAAKSLVQQMGEDPGRTEHVEYAKVALDELDRVERSISHLLRFAREEDIAISEISMRDVVDSALESMRDRFEAVGLELACEIDTEGTMRGDPEKLRRVIINLVSNAIDALEQSGTANPELALAIGENLAGTEVWVRIKDNGPGIDAERLHKIFSPFYTNKQNGTGLGLAISKKLVDAHGGSIEAHSQPGDGTEFILTFPKQPGATEEVPA